MKIFDKLNNWWRKYWTKPNLKKTWFVSRMSEVPDELHDDAYIVQRHGRTIWLVFNCPCKSGHRLALNLSQDRYPFWEIHVRKNRVSVLPSVWVTDECRSHFFIEDSSVVWARERLSTNGGRRIRQ